LCVPPSQTKFDSPSASRRAAKEPPWLDAVPDELKERFESAVLRRATGSGVDDDGHLLAGKPGTDKHPARYNE
jgi:hypothetical protein